MQKQYKDEFAVRIIKMNKILVWGTGDLAVPFLENQTEEEIIGFVETEKSKDQFMGKPVYDSRNLPEHYDYLVVANSYGAEIYDFCREQNMDLSRAIFLYKAKKRVGCTDLDVVKTVLSEKNFINYCMEFDLLDSTFIKEDALEYERLNKRPNFKIQKQYLWSVVYDKYDYAGTVGNYFLQDLWAARMVLESGVMSHFDIGSRLDGFIAHLLAAQIDVTMIDVRKFPGEIEHLHTIVDDATSLRQIADESIESMSALCSLEHFGLGRYGDLVNPEACFQCFENIQKKLKRGGRLYLSLPVGKERVEFNAHRVFYASTVAACFHTLQMEEFSCASQGRIERNVSLHRYDEDPHNGEYRYGLFVFVKK